MHRRELSTLLRRYADLHPDEAALVARFEAFMAAHADCLQRRCAPGHITASCWILDADQRHCLLLRHRKLQRWLQPGGHVDGEPRVELAALREAREESGMQQFELATRNGRLLPLDLDVHAIPAHGSEPAHAHWDVRFLLRARPGQALACSEESLDLRWCEVAAVPSLTTEASVLRLARKAAAWLPVCGWQPA